MDRAIEALDADDVAAARRLCEEMKQEWRYLHDLMAAGLLGLISFVQEKLGDEGVAAAWRFGSERGWRVDVEKIEQVDRKQIVYALAATWRAHSASGTGPNPGAFEIEEDDEKFTFRMRRIRRRTVVDHFAQPDQAERPRSAQGQSGSSGAEGYPRGQWAERSCPADCHRERPRADDPAREHEL
jgi:hypothetical protein